MKDYVPPFTITRITPEQIQQLQQQGYDVIAGNMVGKTEYVLLNKDKVIDMKFQPIELKQEIRAFFLQEINALEEAKKILKGEVNISENEKTKKLKAIFIPREYLYLHFPDGYKFSLDLSFLKRVRAEMDFFLKEFKTDLTLLDD